MVRLWHFPFPSASRTLLREREPLPADGECAIVSESWLLNKVALVLAAHGDRGEAIEQGRANSSLLSHRDELAAVGVFRTVTAGVLKGDPTLEAALEAARTSGANRFAIYPMFMADGYFVKRVLPERIAAMGMGSGVRILTPLGLDEAVVPLVMTEAAAAANAAGFHTSTARLLVVGHGSQLGPASADATKLAAARLRATGTFADVSVAFLEEAPFLNDALGNLRLPTVVAGFFSGDGLHASEDIPAAIREAGANAVYSGSLGRMSQLPALIERSVRAALAGD